MRAMMSDHKARIEASKEWGNFLGYGYGEAALEEARGILAKVEPQDGNVEWSRISYRRAPQIARNGVVLSYGLDSHGEALAESLAAWIERS